MTKGSKNSYVSSVRILLCYLECEGLSIEEVDKLVLQKYLDYLTDQRGIRYKSLKSHFSAYSALFEWLIFEDKLTLNPIPSFRKRYLRRYKGGKGFESDERKLISIEEMARLVNSTPIIRDQAVILLLAKTGVRRGELINVDLADIDFDRMSITLKQTAKRSNRLVFFDEEAKRVLHGWLRMRASFAREDCDALFITESGGRANKNVIYDIVTGHAGRVGLHNPKSKRLQDRFTPHCCRHWFTTFLDRNGMKREYIKWLRGDATTEAIDIYSHIDPEDVRRQYLALIPRLGIR